MLDAVEDDNLEAVEAALKAGAHVNYANKVGDTALMKAAESVHIEVVKMLIEHGANINHIDNNGDTTLIIDLMNMTVLAASSHPRLLAIARLLIEHGARIPTQEELQGIAQRYQQSSNQVEKKCKTSPNEYIWR